MVAIDAIVAVVWAAFLTLTTVVLTYFGFVVSGRQDLESHQIAEEAPSVVATDAQPVS
mgnify:CR=1 FL=1